MEIQHNDQIKYNYSNISKDLISYQVLDSNNVNIHTIQQMGQIVQDTSKDAVFLNFINNLVSTFNQNKQGQSLYTWLQKNTVYINDPPTLEFIRTPKFQILNYLTNRQLIAGDCDDLALLATACYYAIGYGAGFRLLSKDCTEWHHIYSIIFCPITKEWEAIDLTNKNFSFGEEYPACDLLDFSVTVPKI